MSLSEVVDRHRAALLIAAGALPARDNNLESFDHWSSRCLDQIQEPEDRQVIASYLRWHLRPRLVTLADAGQLYEVHIAHDRQQVNAAIGYLDELRGGGQRLEELNQTDLDRLFAERPAHAVSLRNFLSYVVSSGRSDPLRLPCYRSRRRDVMEQERRIELIPLRDDEQLDLVDRVAGLLVLSLAQPVARIVSLRTDAIGRVGNEVTIRL